MIDIELDGFFGQELLSQSTQMLRSRPIVVAPACNLTSMQNCLFGGAGDNRPCSRLQSSNRSPGGSRNSRRRFATDSRLASHCRGRFPIVARTTAGRMKRFQDSIRGGDDNRNRPQILRRLRLNITYAKAKT